MIVSILTFIIIVMSNVTVNNEFKIDEPIIELSTFIFAALWPITLFGILVIKGSDEYKNMIKSKVACHVAIATIDSTYINTLTTKELKLIAHAKNIDAIKLSSKLEKQIEDAINNKIFEESFLSGG